MLRGEAREGSPAAPARTCDFTCTATTARERDSGTRRFAAAAYVNGTHATTRARELARVV